MANSEIDKMLESFNHLPDFESLKSVNPIVDHIDYQSILPEKPTPIPIVPLLKEIAKSNSANTKEIQRLNKLNEEANERIKALENQIIEIQSSHKHDRLKEFLISAVTAIIGAASGFLFALFKK